MLSSGGHAAMGVDGRAGSRFRKTWGCGREGSAVLCPAGGVLRAEGSLGQPNQGEARGYYDAARAKLLQLAGQTDAPVQAVRERPKNIRKINRRVGAQAGSSIKWPWCKPTAGNARRRKLVAGEREMQEENWRGGLADGATTEGRTRARPAKILWVGPAGGSS